MTELPEFAKEQEFLRVYKWDIPGDYRSDGSKGEELHLCEIDAAELVSSRLASDRKLHRPVLDIDFPAALVPSGTAGHYHLYLDRPMPWRKYKRLLRALRRAGIIEPGFASMSLYRGFTDVRVPWKPKEKK